MQAISFSESVSTAVAESWRPSTSLLYDNRWGKFVQLRRRHGVGDRVVTIPMVAEFSMPILASCSAHEIRALPLSLASWTSVSFVVSGWLWNSHNTFNNLQICDIQPHLEGIDSLGPIVAAQTIISQ